MPKKTLHIGDFGGGLNNIKSERDIEVEESPLITNVEIEDQGRIKAIGSAKKPYLSFSTELPFKVAGNGLFSFSHDYDMLANNSSNTTTSWKHYSSNTAVSETDTNYIVKQNGRYLSIYDGTNGYWHTQAITLDENGSDTYEPEFTIVNGGLRVIDRNNLDGEVKLLTHIKRDLFKPSSGTPATTINRWWVGDAHLKPLKVVAMDDTGTENQNLESSDTCGYIALHHVGGDPGVNAPGGTWQTGGTNTDENRRPDRPGICVRYGWIDDVSDKATWSDDTTYSIWAAPIYDAHFLGSNMQIGALVKLGDLDKSSSSTTENMKLILAVQVQPQHGANSFPTGSIEQHMTAICDRLTGVQLYISDNEDMLSESHLLCEIDFADGLRHGERTSSEPWSAEYEPTVDGTDHQAFCSPNDSFKSSGAADGLIFDDPPSGASYRDQAGYPEGISTKATYKTSTVIGKQVYIGNIKHNGKAYNDKVISSQGPDLYPEDVAQAFTTNDGEPIIALESLGTELLQFKRNTLYIIDTQPEIDHIKSEHPFAGVEQPYQVCKTPHGVYWVNALGLHRYDGEKLINLSDLKLRRTQGTSPFPNTWNWTGYASIGYDQKNHKILIFKDVRTKATAIAGTLNKDWYYDADGITKLTYAAEAWIYNIRLNAWTNGLNIVTDEQMKTNFSNSPEGDLIYGLKDIATVLYNEDDTEGNELKYSFFAKVLENVKDPYSGSDSTIQGAQLVLQENWSWMQGKKFIDGESSDLDVTTAFFPGDYFIPQDSMLRFRGTAGGYIEGADVELLNTRTYFIPDIPQAVTASGSPAGQGKIYFEPSRDELQDSIHYRIVNHPKSVFHNFRKTALADQGEGQGAWAGTGDQDAFLTWLASHASGNNWNWTDTGTSAPDAVWNMKVVKTGAGTDITDVALFFTVKEIDNATNISFLSGSSVFKWDNNPYPTQNFTYVTKELDFGNPATAKRIKKVYITFKTTLHSGEYYPSDVKVDLIATTKNGTQILRFQDGINYANSNIAPYGYNDPEDNSQLTFQGLMAYPLANDEKADSSGQMIAILTPNTTYATSNGDTGGADAKDIYACQIKIYSRTGKAIPAGFEIEDISIVYREKGIK